MILRLPILKLSPVIQLMFVVQIITLIVLLVSIIVIPSHTLGTIEQLPPTSVLYGGGAVLWIGAGRSIAHLIIMMMNLSIGALLIWHGLRREQRIIKFITVAFGIHLLLAALVHITIAGVVTIGGWWHILAVIAAAITAVISVSTAVIFAILNHDLHKLGAIHDQHTSTLGTK